MFLSPCNVRPICWFSLPFFFPPFRAAKSAQDLEDRSVNWIADTFCNGSPHIRDIVNGKVKKDLPWSRLELTKICQRIVSLFEKVDLREKTADQLSAKTRKSLQQSESREFSEVSIALHSLRLGEVRSKEFERKVRDDHAKDDFTRAFGDDRAFKHFAKQLDAALSESASKSQASTPARRRNRRGSNRSRGRGGRKGRGRIFRRNYRSYNRRQYNNQYNNNNNNNGNNNNRRNSSPGSSDKGSSQQS